MDGKQYETLQKNLSENGLLSIRSYAKCWEKELLFAQFDKQFQRACRFKLEYYSDRKIKFEVSDRRKERLGGYMQEMKDPGARILIADDEEAFLHPTSLFLRNHGFICDSVQSTEEAAAALATNNYDLLVIDINMPGNTNLEFLRDRPQFSSFLPVIIVTGYPTLNTAVESLRLAVVDYKTKPLDLPEFLETVRGAVNKAKVVRVMREARQGFGTWLDQVNQMEVSLLSRNGSAPLRGISGDLDWYLGEAIQRFANLSVNLVSAVQTLKRGLPEGRTDVCSLMNCSRLAALERSLRETVDVLVKTKSSFKSKELADLRKKLEVVLKNEISVKAAQ